MTQVVARAPILSFVVLALAISWGIWTPLVLGSTRPSGAAAWVIYYAGVIGPAAAALICAVLGSAVTPAALLRRLSRWKLPFRWYAIAILLPFAVRGVAVAGVLLSQGASWRVALRPAETIARITVLMVLLVPFEEIGWRGYLLPLLQRRWTPLASSVIVGGVWALWHLPLAWASVGYQRSDEPWRYMAYFVGTIIPVSCVATWLFNRTGESLLLVSLFHIAINLADFILVLPSRIGEPVLLVTSIVTTFVVGAAWWRDNETVKQRRRRG
ncbi:MAG TPA: type II CAAX endopeptidase family protein [Thermoanaerobaculia bacterium]|nr:type II CAAX endopeptidase family protein [Thermoanaerobaculia bacterium]